MKANFSDAESFRPSLENPPVRNQTAMDVPVISP
jgi:hypothetical protein